MPAISSRLRGFTLVELMFAMLVLGMCLAIIAQLGHFLMQDNARLQRRALALEHATNLLEQLRSQPWEKLTEGRTALPLPAHLADVLPQGQASTVVSAHAVGSASCRRLAVEIRWKEMPNYVASIELVGFRCPRRAEAASQDRGGGEHGS